MNAEQRPAYNPVHVLSALASQPRVGGQLYHGHNPSRSLQCPHPRDGADDQRQGSSSRGRDPGPGSITPSQRRPFSAIYCQGAHEGGSDKGSSPDRLVLGRQSGREGEGGLPAGGRSMGTAPRTKPFRCLQAEGSHELSEHVREPALPLTSGCRAPRHSQPGHCCRGTAPIN